MAILNSVNLHRKNPDIPIPDPSRWYVIALGGHTNQIFHILPLTIPLNTTIQMCARILVHPIQVDSEEIIIGEHGVIFLEVSLAC